MARQTKKTTRQRVRSVASWVFSLALVFSMTPVGAFAVPGDDEAAGEDPAIEQPLDDEVGAPEASEPDAGNDETIDVEDEPALSLMEDGVEAGAGQSDEEAEIGQTDDIDTAKADEEENSDGGIASADFVEKDGLEAVDIQGEAVESEEAAAEALEALDGVSTAKADEIAEELLAPGFELMADDDDDPDGDGIPRQGDGTQIESIKAKWITPDTVDNGDPGLLYIKPSGDNEQSVRLQVNYALSGEHA